VVEGTSVLLFKLGFSDKRFLYLDDLSIDKGAELDVQGWVEGTHFFLVRKTSRNLEDALNKIKFKGYDPSKIHLEDYSDEYWMINGAPEPATYGAGLMLGVLGLVCYRRRSVTASI